MNNRANKLIVRMLEMKKARTQAGKMQESKHISKKATK